MTTDRTKTAERFKERVVKGAAQMTKRHKKCPEISEAGRLLYLVSQPVYLIPGDDPIKTDDVLSVISHKREDYRHAGNLKIITDVISAREHSRMVKLSGHVFGNVDISKPSRNDVCNYAEPCRGLMNLEPGDVLWVREYGPCVVVNVTSNTVTFEYQFLAGTIDVEWSRTKVSQRSVFNAGVIIHQIGLEAFEALMENIAISYEEHRIHRAQNALTYTMTTGLSAPTVAQCARYRLAWNLYADLYQCEIECPELFFGAMRRCENTQKMSLTVKLGLGADPVADRGADRLFPIASDEYIEAYLTNKQQLMVDARELLASPLLIRYYTHRAPGLEATFPRDLLAQVLKTQVNVSVDGLKVSITYEVGHHQEEPVIRKLLTESSALRFGVGIEPERSLSREQIETAWAALNRVYR